MTRTPEANEKQCGKKKKNLEHIPHFIIIFEQDLHLIQFPSQLCLGERIHIQNKGHARLQKAKQTIWPHKNFKNLYE